ncbi:acyltransferase family protein [Polaribacter sp.]|nr:acyltransferase family protein [Polaribacter sp.]
MSKENTLNTQRIDWIDQVKGFGIILVVYGHNFPSIEDYIYSFHMPLFFLLAGIFHPKKSNFQVIKKRVQQILIPYFLWSFLLFIFWFSVWIVYALLGNRYHFLHQKIPTT